MEDYVDGYDEFLNSMENSGDPSPKDITHGIVAIDGDSRIIHFVGYWTIPSDNDFKSIQKELETDPEFGLNDIPGWTLRLATDKEVTHFANGGEYENI